METSTLIYDSNDTLIDKSLWASCDFYIIYENKLPRGNLCYNLRDECIMQCMKAMLLKHLILVNWQVLCKYLFSYAFDWNMVIAAQVLDVGIFNLYQ